MTERPIPTPILAMLKDQFPMLVAGNIDDNKNVYLLMQDNIAWHYIAGDDFMQAVRVAESGSKNLLFYIGNDKLDLTLLPSSNPPSKRRRVK